MSGHPHDLAWDTATSNVMSGVAGNVTQANMIAGGVHIHSVARAPVGLPYRAGSFPPRAMAFQDRDVANVLAETLKSEDAAVLSSDSVVISGMGGVGKTQVALDYADREWASGKTELVVWVTAASREAIISSFARIAADLTGIDDPLPELGAQRLLEWLAVTRVRWLIVMDDLQCPDDLRGLRPPATPAGRVVVTTRRRDAALRGHGRRMLEVGLFTPAEAYAYLRAALADQPSLLEGAADLSAAVGYLPLALAQASAYLRDRTLSCADYQRRLTDRRGQLASLLPESDALPDEHGMTAAATWSLSVEQANQLQPQGVAGPLLEVASLLDPNGIPFKLFATEAVTSLLTTILGRELDQEQTRDGLNCLRRLSLITLDLSSRQVHTHALVQRATRDNLIPQQRATITRAAADGLLEMWPEAERDLFLAQVLRANTEALSDTAAEYLWQPNMHYVLHRAGWSLEQAGLLTQARDHYQRMHTSANNYLGSDHPDTLHARMLVARCRGEWGEPAEAAAALEELLTSMHRLHGPDHGGMLNVRHNLAFFRGKAGDPAGAATAFNELLVDMLRRFGPDHAGTLNVRHRHAYWTGKAGAPAEAAAAFKQMLPDCQRVLGSDDTLTLKIRRNLAHWRGEAGDPIGAAAALEELLADYQRVLGPDHPYTLKIRRNLAHWRGEAGDPIGAAAALEELLADYQRVLGPDHPYTLNVRHNLAHWTKISRRRLPTDSQEG